LRYYYGINGQDKKCGEQEHESRENDPICGFLKILITKKRVE
jgi:hypothetical protein